MSTLRALLHVPTVLFAIGVIRFAHWFKQNGWIASTLKVGFAVASVLTVFVLIAP